jgi:hypothetical protein
MMVSLGLLVQGGLMGLGLVSLAGTVFEMLKEIVETRRGQRVLVVTWHIPVSTATPKTDLERNLAQFMASQGIRVADPPPSSEKPNHDIP